MSGLHAKGRIETTSRLMRHDGIKSRGNWFKDAWVARVVSGDVGWRLLITSMSRRVRKTRNSVGPRAQYAGQ